jgi:hypothetical protein
VVPDPGQASRPESLRQQAARAGVETSAADLEAVRSFLDAILPELERLEAELDPDEGP